MIVDTPSVPTILGVIITLLTLDVVVVCLRFYARRRLKQRLQIDDWLMIPCIILIFGCSATLFHGIRFKTMGYRAEVPILESGLSPDSLQSRSDPYAADRFIVMTRMLEHAFFCIFLPTLGFVKISVLCLYRRLFVVHKKWSDPRNLVITSLIVIVAMWATAYTFALIFNCGTYFTAVWYDYDLADRVCINTMDVGYTFAITDLITDVLIILIPVPLIWRLHLPIGQRLAVLGVFMMGALAFVASLVRLIVSVWVRHVGDDPTFDEELIMTAELFWGILEAAVGLIAACLPTLRALVKIEYFDSAVRSMRGIFSLGSRSQFSSTDSTKSPRLYQSDTATSEKGSGIVVREQSASLEHYRTLEDRYNVV